MVTRPGPAPLSDRSQVMPPTAPGIAPAVAAQGLTAAEAARRLSQFGPNQVKTGGRFQVLQTGLGLLANPLVLILLAASAHARLAAAQAPQTASACESPLHCSCEEAAAACLSLSSRPRAQCHRCGRWCGELPDGSTKQTS
jgi:hypothetical protein